LQHLYPATIAFPGTALTCCFSVLRSLRPGRDKARRGKANFSPGGSVPFTNNNQAITEEEERFTVPGEAARLAASVDPEEPGSIQQPGCVAHNF
jgi:hypothetical protein